MACNGNGGCGCETCRDKVKKMSPAVRRQLLTLVNIMPMHADKFVRKLKQANLMALQEGEPPVGPDMDIEPQAMVRYLLNALVGRESFGAQQ
jgi:hypothetical protein